MRCMIIKVNLLWIELWILQILNILNEITASMILRFVFLEIMFEWIWMNGICIYDFVYSVCSLCIWMIIGDVCTPIGRPRSRYKMAWSAISWHGMCSSRCRLDYGVKWLDTIWCVVKCHFLTMWWFLDLFVLYFYMNFNMNTFDEPEDW